MHMHGHNFWVVAEGTGVWDGTVTRPKNPQRRDVQMLQPGSADTPGYIVIEFNADNPGVWPLHCHIAWHVSAGLYVNVMVNSSPILCTRFKGREKTNMVASTQERPDLITQQQIPSIMAQTCRDWATYSGHNVVEEIDSGL